LRESEQKYRNLFINITEEVHFWQLVRDEAGDIKTWRLVDANPPTLKTWGRETLDEIRGKTTDEIFGLGAAEHYMPVVQKIFTEGTPYSYVDYFPNLDKHFRFTSVPIDDFFITTGADITTITKAHELVRVSEKRLKRSQEVAHLGSWELDLKADKLTWSDEVYRIFGLKPQEFGATYEAFLERVHPDDRKVVNDAYSSSIRDGRDAYEIEHRVIRKDNGKVRTVHEKCEHFRDPVTGEIVRSVGMVQDITERNLMEEELRRSRDELELRVEERTAELSATVTMLEQANMELQEFTHVTSHDLQEPLRKIQTFCDLLNKRSASFLDNAGQEYLNRVLNSVLRMRQLLSDLLQLSRLAGKSEPFEAVDLGKMAHEAVDLFEEDLKKSGGTVKIDVLPVIDAEETQMLRLFQNLVGNAVKYHDEKKLLINIFSRHNGDICEIFIKDNGIGFEQEFAERIFKPFQRLHGRNQYEGTGIGLAICRKIVERHGGSIRAESEPGKGSTFIINLPVKHKRIGGTDDN
jgi:PAS domain S-box-containing protein